MEDGYFWKKKNGQGLEISPSVLDLGERDEKNNFLLCEALK